MNEPQITKSGDVADGTDFWGGDLASQEVPPEVRGSAENSQIVGASELGAEPAAEAKPEMPTTGDGSLSGPTTVTAATETFLTLAEMMAEDPPMAGDHVYEIRPSEWKDVGPPIFVKAKSPAQAAQLAVSVRRVQVKELYEAASRMLRKTEKP